MTFTRRQTIIGAVATVTTAALPAEEVVYYTDPFGNEWAGGAEYIECVRLIQERDVMHQTDGGWKVIPAVEFYGQTT
jgi:hypothetical protein